MTAPDTAAIRAQMTTEADHGYQRLRAITAMHNTILILCDALDAERAENERLRAMIRVNAIRYLNMSHEDIDAAIRAALSSTGEKG